MRIVVALGGNALARRDEPLDAEHQLAHVRTAAAALAELASEHQIVVTHGNGPQVGMLAAHPSGLPLDVLGAETEGMIGYWVEQELSNLLPGRDVATLLTQVEVSPDDPAFASPRKPIGPLHSKETAERLAVERGWEMAPDDDHGYRRVVPSPEPQRIVELRTIQLLVRLGVVVVCGGGGGIPVVRGPRGALHGVEAVIDKDLFASLLAGRLDADFLLMLTDVPGVFADWPMATRLIRRSPPRRLREFHFEPGSMGPKVEGAYRFARRPGAAAGIGALEDAARIVKGEVGTLISAHGGTLEIEEVQPTHTIR